MKKRNFINKNIFSILFYYILFIILIFLRDFFDININEKIFTVLAGFVFVLKHKEEGLAFLIFMLPFKGGLGYHEIIFVYLIIYIFKQFSKIKIDIKIIIPMLFLLIELFHQFSLTSSLREYLHFFVYIIVVTLLLYDVYTKEGLLNIFHRYCIGVICAGINLLAIVIKREGIYLFTSGQIRLGINDDNSTYYAAHYVTGLNSNELGLFILVAISLVLILRKCEKIKVISVFYIIILLVIGFCTMSRAFLFGLLFIGVFIIFISVTSIKGLLKTILYISLIFLFFYYLANGPVNNIAYAFRDRFFVDDLSNGRIDLMVNYFNQWEGSFRGVLFGYGMQNYRVLGVDDVSAHNAIQEILLSWGISGFILVVLWIAGMYKHQRKFNNAKISQIVILPLCVFLITIQSGQFISNYSYLVVMMLTLLCIRINILNIRDIPGL